MRKYISAKIKQKIRLYYKLHPKATCREVTDYIMPDLRADGWIGKPPHKTTFSDIKNEKDPIADEIVDTAKKELIKTSSKELASIIKNRLSWVNKIEAKIIKELNQKLNENEGRVSKELISMFKDITEIRSKIMGVVELSVEFEGDPTKVKNLQLVEEVLNEIENQSKTKIKTKITAIRPDPTPRTKTSDSPTEDEGGEDSSGEQD